MKKYIRFTPFFLALVSAVLFGVTTPFNKILLGGLNPFLLAGLLYLGASISLFPVIVVRGEIPRLKNLNRSNRLRLSGSVFFGGVLGPVLILSGLRFASASSVSLWLNLELAATALLGLLFFRDHLGTRGWVGVLSALVSGVLLSINEGSAGAVAALLVGAACICWGLDNHFTALIDGISAVQSTFVKGIVAGLVNTAAGIIVNRGDTSHQIVIYSLILGGISYGASIVLYIISAQKLGAIRSQIIFSSAPFVGVFFSVLFLAERISGIQIVSFGMFIFSVAMFISEKHEHHHHHHEVEHTHFHRHDDLHHNHHHEEDTRYHEHFHRHDRGEHVHPHLPDMHHRHGH